MSDCYGAARQATLSAALRAVIAIERVRAAGEPPPAQLADLEAPAVLTDPMTLAPLRYRREAGSYTVYGVGADGQDNNGNLGDLSPHSVSWSTAPESAPDWEVSVSLAGPRPPV